MQTPIVLVLVLSEAVLVLGLGRIERPFRPIIGAGPDPSDSEHAQLAGANGVLRRIGWKHSRIEYEHEHRATR